MSGPKPTPFLAATIGETLARLFPGGTRPGTRNWRCMPHFPTDVFAAAALLLDRGDVYRAVAPFGPPRHLRSRHLVFDETERRSWIEAGEAWRHAGLDKPGALARIAPYWKVLWAYRDEPLNRDQDRTDVPRWWKAALALLVIADEACAGIGFDAGIENAIAEPIFAVIEGDSHVTEPIGTDDRHRRYRESLDSLCVMADPYSVRVLPKARTPGVGCTLRTLSRHLALLPPRGTVELSWLRNPAPVRRDGDALNILAIPLPYALPAGCFRPIVTEDSPAHADWGWFDIDQSWLRHERDKKAAAGQLSDFVRALIERAENDTGAIHGVIFPELALDWPIYDKIVRALCEHAPNVEFLVAGSSGDCSDALGNFVLTTTFHEHEGRRRAITYSRAKHHRWRVDGSQIREYGLGSALDPHKTWWEGNDVVARQAGLNVFRERSVFSVMICEDLARSEPCHGPLRSIGPNLVFVLLMDGPQIPQRWPARYATTLADDPGSSVLTLTCLGLMERTNAMGRRAENRSVGLWKDDVSGAIPLHLPRGAHGLVITLSGKQVRDATLDGRASVGSQAWRYHGHQPVRLENHDYDRFRWIVG